jgi:hypothetical protein
VSGIAPRHSRRSCTRSGPVAATILITLPTLLIDKTLFDRAQAVSAHRNDTRATAHRFPYTGLLKCARCGCAITAEIKKNRYIYYHCTFDKGNCGGLYVREEELEQQFGEIFGEFQFSEALFDWMREALRQSQKEKAEFHRRSIEKLNAHYVLWSR